MESQREAFGQEKRFLASHVHFILMRGSHEGVRGTMGQGNILTFPDAGGRRSAHGASKVGLPFIGWN